MLFQFHAHTVHVYHHLPVSFTIYIVVFYQNDSKQKLYLIYLAKEQKIYGWSIDDFSHNRVKAIDEEVEKALPYKHFAE